VDLKIVVLVLASVCALLLSRKLVDFVANVQRRRHAAISMAHVLTDLGLVEIPKSLTDYATGGYAQMFKQMERCVQLFLSGTDAVVKEFSQVFERVLAKKVATPEGLAYLRSVVDQASKAAAAPTKAA
jgi:hypothetical protein